MIDGAPLVVERGIAGDHRFVHGTRAVHHLSPDASVLQCAPSDPADPSWWRVVLDSVLFSVALLQGYEALHAGAIATPDGVIAITAASGGGKSTLLSELLQRGLALMADDVLVLASRGTDPPLAHPAAPLMTVPATRIPTLRQESPAETISSLEQERWIAVPVHPEPLPLKALVVLDRQPGLQLSGLQTSLEKIENPLAPLLGSLMDRYVGARYGDVEDAYPLGGYSTTDAALNYAFLNSVGVLKDAKIGVTAQNLANKTSIYFLSGYTGGGAPLWFTIPGRSFQITLSASLQ